MPLHVGKGRNISTAISDIIDYVENPQKTDFGKFIYGYECDTRLADAEFLLSKRQYANLTGRNQGADDVIAYHLRQAFKPLLHWTVRKNFATSGVLPGQSGE